jgi:hypothetical protein
MTNIILLFIDCQIGEYFIFKDKYLVREIDGQKIAFAAIDKDKTRVHLISSLFNTVKRFFSLSYDDCVKYFRMWFKEHHMLNNYKIFPSLDG